MEDIIVIFLIPMVLAIFIMVPTWFVVVSKYFKFLRENHSDIYTEIGEPSLLTNNTPSSTVSFMRYICGNKYMHTNDNQLISKSLFLKRFFYSYLFIFIGLIIGMFALGNS